MRSEILALRYLLGSVAGHRDPAARTLRRDCERNRGRTVIESVVHSRRNGPLIAAVAKLWIEPDDVVLDITYGRGRFWTDFTPVNLVTHDIAIDGVDFRKLPEADNSVDVVAFDPPYVSVGGRKTTTIPDFFDRYGLTDAPKTPAEVSLLMAQGVVEAARVLKLGGRLMIKSSDYISSGKYHPGHVLALEAAIGAGLEMVDEFCHYSGLGPQPTKNLDGSPRQQKHSRRAHSFLSVFMKTLNTSVPQEGHLRRTFGMRKGDYLKLLGEQAGGCAICGATDPGGHGVFHVDHDRACCPGKVSCGACIRGLLCTSCNLGIGSLGDSSATLRAAADYLDRPKNRNAVPVRHMRSPWGKKN